MKIRPLQKKFSEALSHRDYLGAVLNLGIERSKIGDILVPVSYTHLDMMSVEDVTEILAVNLLGAIPDDEQILIGTNQGAVSYTHLDVYKRQIRHQVKMIYC